MTNSHETKQTLTEAMDDAEYRRAEADRVLSSLRDRQGAEEKIAGLAEHVIRLAADLNKLHDDLFRWQAMLETRARGLGPETTPLPAGEAPEKLDLGADELRHIRNWYQVESHDGRPFMWSGPETESRIALEFSRSKPRKIQLHVLGCLDPEGPTGLRLYADGVQVELDSDRDGATPPWVLSGIVPASLRQEPTELRLMLPRVLPANFVNPGNSDSRLLGIALTRLQIGDP